ncbi:taste receptor type 2 member 7-like [Spea bombifrons]|uniref:taste receptor type 2 member 7-like n=1 Tax=Spea bombifrons TaxID=233779 RepID=UPI00234BFEA8|nr:taste receptor type 2 member 7-like [Spea bombifrons]
MELNTMVPLHFKVGFTISIFECVAGVLLNSFIVMVNFLDWKQGNKLSPCDKILALIAFNNIFLQCDMNVYTFIFIVIPAMVEDHAIHSTISVFLLFQFYYSFWMTSCLCFYYCLSIVNFKHTLLIRMRQRIPIVVSSQLLVSAVASFAISVLSIWNIEIEHFKQTDNSTANPSKNTKMSIEITPVYRAITIFSGCCLPFCIAVLSAALVLVSLWSHTWSMKQNSGSFSVSHIEAHRRAAGIIILLTLLFAVFYAAEVTLLSSSMAFQTFWEFVSLFFVLIYPTAQSFVLILGNTKLRRTCRQICHCS